MTFIALFLIIRNPQQVRGPFLPRLDGILPVTIKIGTYLRGRLLHSRRQRTSGILSSKAAIPDVYTVAQLGLGYPLERERMAQIRREQPRYFYDKGYSGEFQ